MKCRTHQTTMTTITIAALLILSSCTISEQANTTTEIKIGVLAPLSGPVAKCGQAMRRGIKLAKNNKNIELIWKDTQFKPSKAVTLAHQLIHQHNVQYILGPCSSSATLAVAPIANTTKTLLFTPVSYADKISKAGEYIFRAAPTAKTEAPIAAALATKLNKTKAGIIHVNNDYGKSYATNFEKSFKPNGTVKATVSVHPGMKDFKTQLTKMRATKVDILILPVVGNQPALITHDLHSLGWNVTTIVASVGERTSYLRKGIHDRNDYILSLIGNASTAFTTKWNQSNQHPIPSIEAAESYVTMQIMEQGIQRCGKQTECMQDVLYSIENYKTPFGNISIDDNGDVQWPDLTVKQAKNHSFTPVHVQLPAQR